MNKRKLVRRAKRTLKKPCSRCGKPIEAGQDYQRAGKIESKEYGVCPPTVTVSHFCCPTLLSGGDRAKVFSGRNSITGEHILADEYR